MASGGLKDTEVLVCVLLQERAPLSLRDLSRWVGDLKAAFRAEREQGALEEALHGLEGCVDDVPKAVRLLMERGVIERVGASPRDWRYRLCLAIKACENLPAGALEALRSRLDRMRPR
jgi:hypothetical protein